MLVACAACTCRRTPPCAASSWASTPCPPCASCTFTWSRRCVRGVICCCPRRQVVWCGVRCGRGARAACQGTGHGDGLPGLRTGRQGSKHGRHTCCWGAWFAQIRGSSTCWYQRAYGMSVNSHVRLAPGPIAAASAPNIPHPQHRPFSYLRFHNANANPTCRTSTRPASSTRSTGTASPRPSSSPSMSWSGSCEVVVAWRWSAPSASGSWRGRP